ncbi:MAG TPA: nucleotidyltransferase domain-containing protein [Acidimicrobiales bacterium]|nr:nucleotidyltransferase domain-containing protein [Acidimicrobiales bacterium]
MEHISERLAQIPGVVAVTLGGSRARDEARPDSDWDFGLYYRGTILAADIEALGWPGEVSEPRAWGPVVNGGAWLTIEGEHVDLCYRDLDEVMHAVGDAEDGRWTLEPLATYVAGIPTYVMVGELALCKVLSGILPRPEFPPALAVSAPPRWRQLARMALLTASTHAGLADVTATVANLGQAALFEAHARLAERRRWALNEKGLLTRAGLSSLDDVLAAGITRDGLPALVSDVANRLEIEARALRES